MSKKKSIYNLSGGQLIVLWVFGGIIWLWLFNENSKWAYNPPDYFFFLMVIIPAVLAFYTIGWINHRNKKTG